METSGLLSQTPKSVGIEGWFQWQDRKLQTVFSHAEKGEASVGQDQQLCFFFSPSFNSRQNWKLVNVLCFYGNASLHFTSSISSVHLTVFSAFEQQALE